MAPFAASAPGVVEQLRTLADSYRFDLIEEFLAQRLTAAELKGEQHD